MTYALGEKEPIVIPMRAHGAKGIGKDTASTSSAGGNDAPNTLRSNAQARLIDLLGEGVIEGFPSEHPLMDVYFDQTPVMNKNGRLNFSGVKFQWRRGLAEQAELKGFGMAETPFAVNTRVYKDQGPVVRTISDEDATAVRVVVTIPALSLTKTSEKYAGIYANRVSYAFDVKASNGGWEQVLIRDIKGKCTSPYQIAHRLDLPNDGYPWQVRMRRITQDSEDDLVQNQTYWDSYVELVENRLTYMHSAVAAIEIDAEQFGNSVPSRSYRVRGVRFRVPTNYDPETGTYDGVWNGNFKTAWTNNPAWVFYGLITQDRFGLGDVIDANKIDTASLYQIARYCDQRIPDGDGGQIRRYTFNGVLNTLQEAHKALQQIAAVFRGMSFWSLGQIYATADMPKDPVVLVTKANTIGGFEYSSTAMKARHTAAAVGWNDPDDFYKSAIELVTDPAGVRRYGWRQADVTAVGCTNRAQAHYVGRWLLDTEQNETETVTYRASFDHTAQERNDVVTGVLPGDIVEIADPRKANVRAGGRIESVTSLTRVVLDRYFNMGAADWDLKVTLRSGRIATARIANINPETRLCILRDELPNEPMDGAVYIISGANLRPRQYRVIENAEEQKNVFRITGLFFDPQKFERVEQGIRRAPIRYSRPEKDIQPPSNLNVKQVRYFRDGVPKTRLILSFTPGADFLSAGYIVRADTPAGEVRFGRIGSSTLDVDDVQAGEWTFYVRAVGNGPGITSETVKIDFTAAGWRDMPKPTIENLRVQGGGTTFTGKAATIVWDANWPQNAVEYDLDYIVKILDADTDALIRRSIVPNERYTYSYENNVADARRDGIAGARRRFKVEVCARDLEKIPGDPAVALIQNPPPAMTAVTANSAGQSIFLSIPDQPDDDFGGTRFWISTVSGFDPLAVASVKRDAAVHYITSGEYDTTYYVRAAAYDVFSSVPSGLNISPQVSVTVQDTIFDVQPPTIPGTPVFDTPVAEIALDGTVTSKLRATWTASEGNEFAHLYEVAIAEGAGNEVILRVSGEAWEAHGFKPNQEIKIRVRSVSANGFAVSGWTPIVTATTAKNTASPANPTGSSITAGFERAFMTWVAPANADLDFVEVWSIAGNNAATAPPGGAAKIAQVSARSTFFTDPSLGTTATKTYWIRSVNTSGIAATSYVRVGVATSIALVGTQISDEAVTTPKLAAGSVTTDRLLAGQIDVDTIAATSSISTDKLKANVLTAGNIIVSGATRLSDWSKIGDETRIDGGKISALSIRTEVLTVGNQGLSFSGLDFSMGRNVTTGSPDGIVSWTAGSITYVGSGGPVVTTIAAGSFNTTGAVAYVYWVKDSATLTGVLATATTQLANLRNNPNAVQLATMSGMLGLAVSLGGTIIDGGRMVANSIAAGVLAANAVQADNIAALAIKSGHIEAGAIVTGHMTAGSINGNRIQADTINTLQLAANSVDTLQLKTNSVTATQISVAALSAINANVGVLTAGVIKSPNNQMIIHLDDRYILVSD